MKAYLITSGILFALSAATDVLVAVHHWQSGASDPWFVVVHAAILATSASLAFWAWRLISRKAAA